MLEFAPAKEKWLLYTSGLVCSCALDEGDNLRRRRRLDKCSQDLKNYIEMIDLQHYSYDDPTYACRMCFSDIEKGAKTAVALRFINTRLRLSAGITATDMSVDRHHSIDVVCIT